MGGNYRKAKNRRIKKCVVYTTKSDACVTFQILPEAARPKAQRDNTFKKVKKMQNSLFLENKKISHIFNNTKEKVFSFILLEKQGKLGMGLENVVYTTKSDACVTFQIMPEAVRPKAQEGSKALKSRKCFHSLF